MKILPKLDPVFGTAYALNKWTSIWPELKAQYNQYTKAQYGNQLFGFKFWYTQ